MLKYTKKIVTSELSIYYYSSFTKIYINSDSYIENIEFLNEINKSNYKTIEIIKIKGKSKIFTNLNEEKEEIINYLKKENQALFKYIKLTL